MKLDVSQSSTSVKYDAPGPLVVNSDGVSCVYSYGTYSNAQRPFEQNDQSKSHDSHHHTLYCITDTFPHQELAKYDAG